MNDKPTPQASEKAGAQRSTRQTRRTTPLSRRPSPAPASPVGRLHHAIGNQAVGKLLRSGLVQAKLRIGQPDDKYEREADQVANQVMRMSSSGVQHETCACGQPVGSNGSCENCKSKQETIRRKTKGEGSHTAVPPIVSQALQQPGRPLGKATRAFMEPRFGEDFSDVRVHTNEIANAAASAINAHAYTVGQQIVFGHKSYKPTTHEGRKLIAHELVHTLQQRQRLSPFLARNEDKTATKSSDQKKKETTSDISFGSVKVPWYVLRSLFLKLPSRWQPFAKKSKEKLTKDDREIMYNMVASLQNLVYAGIYTELSSYKPEWSTSLKTVENLSGVTNTYMNLISFALQKDLEKYLGEESSDLYKQHLGWLIIYGAILQGGLIGLNAAMESDLDLTTLLKPATAKWTAAPSGFGRPFQLKNIPDPRWGSYPFWKSPGGFESKVSGFKDAEKPYAFNLNLGLNIVSMADLYPKDEKEKEKYKGFELYPYFTLKHEWKKGDIQPEVKNTWLVGAFVGTNGFYTLLEGGKQQRPDDKVADAYLRQALMLRGLGRLSLLQLSHEYSDRPDHPKVRARLNAATQIKLLDRKNWESTIGAGVGGLLPSGNLPGAFDLSGQFVLQHNYFRASKTDDEPFTSSLKLGSMWRNQDPFDAGSPRLFSLSGKLSILDTVIISVEHHRIRAGQQGPLAPNLPTQDIRLMLMFGPGIFRW